MIWIHISNILNETKFTGIVRTEYELCLYAHQLYEQGHQIGFSTFDERIGFIQLSPQQVLNVLNNLKNGHALCKKLTRKQKFKRSILKRINALKVFFGHVHHYFNDGDVVISVGQKLDTKEMPSFLLIKKQINLQLKFLCHDLMPINYPQFVVSGNDSLFARYINQVIKVADYFYCNSEYTKNELTDYYLRMNTPPPPMGVVTLGCDLYTKKYTDRPNAFLKYITSQKYLLYVSTIEARKNHQLIYDMYIKLIEQGVENLPKVYFVGRRGWKVDELLKKLDSDDRIKDQIVVADNISDTELVLLYQKCWFTIYPSFIEGYGLPVAESLSFGKYCLSSNAGSLPEAGGEFIDYINPYDLEKWREKFLFLINHPEYIAQKEQYIQKHYKAVSWQSCAKQILDVEFANSQHNIPS